MIIEPLTYEESDEKFSKLMYDILLILEDGPKFRDELVKILHRTPQTIIIAIRRLSINHSIRNYSFLNLRIFYLDKHKLTAFFRVVDKLKRDEHNIWVNIAQPILGDFVKHAQGGNKHIDYEKYIEHLNHLKIRGKL